MTAVTLFFEDEVVHCTLLALLNRKAKRIFSKRTREWNLPLTCFVKN